MDGGTYSIQLLGVGKRYGDVVAVQDLSLEIRAGGIFGLLGANGAGKTTTIRMMSGLLKPSEGSVIVGGHDMAREPKAAKALCAYVPDQAFLYEHLTAQEMLEFVADIRGVEEPRKSRNIARYLEYFELADRRDHLIEDFSHGMRQKLALCSAFVYEPSIVYLDEPTNGLDPRSVRRLKCLLVAHCEAGGTVLLSTHILEIAETLCETVAILRRGRLVACGSVADLKAQTHERSLEDVFMGLTEEGVAEGRCTDEPTIMDASA